MSEATVDNNLIKHENLCGDEDTSQTGFMWLGMLAQLVEHLHGMEEVLGSRFSPAETGHGILPSDGHPMSYLGDCL